MTDDETDWRDIARKAQAEAAWHKAAYVDAVESRNVALQALQVPGVAPDRLAWLISELARMRTDYSAARAAYNQQGKALDAEITARQLAESYIGYIGRTARFLAWKAKRGNNHA